MKHLIERYKTPHAGLSMTNLDTLKQALRQEASAVASSPTRLLNDTEYSAGFETLMQGSESDTYRQFIIPQLCQLLVPFIKSRVDVGVLEIGPGPKSLFANLPRSARRNIASYTAFEPNELFATRLEKTLCDTSDVALTFDKLQIPADIRRARFDIELDDDKKKHHIVLLCHSMYGMNPKKKYIEKALRMLTPDGIVVVFHREGTLHIDGLVCHRTASYPTGIASVLDKDQDLDRFGPFIAGFVLRDPDGYRTCRDHWRRVCRALSRRSATHPQNLLFDSPIIMATFSQSSRKLSQLIEEVPSAKQGVTIKNWEARLHRSAATMAPTTTEHVQHCVSWAITHGFGLTVLSGGHSANCLWPNVVAVDMSAFSNVHIINGDKKGGSSELESETLVVVEGGCKTGNIIRRALAEGLTIPLGARPSVGAGLSLQGGISHLSRLHGLACDSIIGAVIVSVSSNEVWCIGQVPEQHWPEGAVRPKNEADLLWAIRGAGTNFGIVLSVTFKAYKAPEYSVRSWAFPVGSSSTSRDQLGELSACIADESRNDCSVDAYLYWDKDQLHMGITTFESASAGLVPRKSGFVPACSFLSSDGDLKTVDSIGVLDADMYISGMHGGHHGGKTSSFKRCLFLFDIGASDVATILVNAFQTRPSPFCYLHLLQGGGAIEHVGVEETAFGCRRWSFACVITGVWPRDQDGSAVAQAAVRWVYSVAEKLLPLSAGAYGADLGADPRDVSLATKAFGPNLPRLARLKRLFDPFNVLAYACPFPGPLISQKLIILVTGESCAGKDHCAAIWAQTFRDQGFRTSVVSISEATKREYSDAVTGVCLNRLLTDRGYKEEHRSAMTAFFENQERQRPHLREEHFMNVVYETDGIDVLFVTGMRDAAPVEDFSYRVPDSRLLEVRIRASNATRTSRGGDTDWPGDSTLNENPSLVFNNENAGQQGVDAAKAFAEEHLLPLVHDDLCRLAHMVRRVPDFPHQDTEFRHVLGVTQQAGGLALSTTLLQTQFFGNWQDVGAIACCEAGGFIFASSLASRVDVPLALIRDAGKLPPPTSSVPKAFSYISGAKSQQDKRIEMEKGAIPQAGSVVVVDDVLSSGRTLCAVLELLEKSGVESERISVIVIAEFPLHRARKLLLERGYGKIRVQSLLVFAGA